MVGPRRRRWRSANDDGPVCAGDDPHGLDTVTVTVIDAPVTVASSGGADALEVGDRSGFGGDGIKSWFVRGAEVVEVDLLGTSSRSSLGVVASGVVCSDDLAAVVNRHTRDQTRAGGDDRDEGGDASSLVAGFTIRSGRCR